MGVLSIERNALRLIQAEARRSAALQLETGGYLFGEVTNDDILIVRATGPGPNALRTPATVRPDEWYTLQKEREFNANRAGKPLLRAGGWHLHGIDGLSTTDIETIRRIAADHPHFVHIVVCGFNQRKIRAFTWEQGKVVEKKWKVVDEPEHRLDFNRTEELLNHSALGKKTVFVLGLGSIGSELVTLLAQAGVTKFILADPEQLEEPNLVRHVGKFHQLGRYKVDIAAELIHLTNPNANITAITQMLEPATIEGFKPYIKKSHVIACCTGSPTDRTANTLCAELRRPGVFAGMFERAEAGFALQYMPHHKRSPCLNCVWDYARFVEGDSNDQRRERAARYGFSEEELASQQGLYIDIKPVAAIQAKMVVQALLRPSQYAAPRLPTKLAVWNSHTMSAHWIPALRRKDCSVCNQEGWLNSRRSALEEFLKKRSTALVALPKG